VSCEAAARGSLPKLGVALGKAHPAFHLELTLAAEALGFESVWMPEHLIFPIQMAGSPYAGQDHPPVPPTTPVYDAFGWLCFLAGKTQRVRLGTNVYLLGIRHPFVAARAVQTLDHVSNGRAEVGIGAGWLREEWLAAGLDPATRGRRLDEAIGIVKRLWTEPEVEHHGEFYDFGPVAFEPKPVQKPWPRLHVGGESDAALRRAARHGDGWIGIHHTPESLAPLLARLRELRAREEREHEPFEVTIGANVRSRGEAERFAELGVHRLMLTPWDRSREAAAGLRRAAELLLG
jgi:probable F420-dependent oxidoreductase